MFKVNSNYSSLTPEGIFPILQNDEWFQKLTPRITENAMLFCTILYLHHYYHKEKNGDNSGDEINPFQRIGSDLVIKILARDMYKEILQRLVKLDLVEINDSYMTGEYTKGYRLNECFITQKVIARKLRFNVKKLEKLNKYFIEQKLLDYYYLIPQYNHLQLIHIDYDSALDYIEKNKSSISNFDHYYRQVHKVYSAFTRKIAVSPENRRVHSSLTSFPKRLRSFLCLVNNETGEMIFNKCTIDGRNTQPLLICVKMEQEGFKINSDFKLFCLQGTIYSQMANELKETRDWVKKYMMKAILFTYNNAEYTHGMDDLNEDGLAKQKISLYFKGRFPDVYNWLLQKKELLKLTGKSNKNVNPGGSLLAVEIQKMEAELWIHRLLKELPPEMIYITIHDSVMLFNPTNEQVKFLEDKVKEIGRQIYNIDIPLSTEFN